MAGVSWVGREPGAIWRSGQYWRHGRPLDAVGFAPQLTPSQVRPLVSGVQLRTYGTQESRDAAVLLIPAPIKRWQIWDLVPDVSVVRRCLDDGLRVYMAEWLDVGNSDGGCGLEHYVDQLLMACIRAVQEDSDQQKVILIKHSLGGTFAAICAARLSRIRIGHCAAGVSTSFRPRRRSICAAGGRCAACRLGARAGYGSRFVPECVQHGRSAKVLPSRPLS
jgi:pimeloyl-ACP methyl ester carboxylesterase